MIPMYLSEEIESEVLAKIFYVSRKEGRVPPPPPFSLPPKHSSRNNPGKN
jgi:hypothetical protein